MTNPDYTHLTLIVDRSGSMHRIRDEAEAGVNTLLAEQFTFPGKLTVTLVEFDERIDTVARMQASQFKYNLDPLGMTRLLDAVGMEIARTGADLAALPSSERPGKVVVVIVTDGEENSSQEYSLEQVRALVDTQRKVFNWQFQFLGAGESAWQGNEMGINSSTYVASKKGAKRVYEEMDRSMKAFRGAPREVGFSMEAVIHEEEELS